jgi:hypothetical protein
VDGRPPGRGIMIATRRVRGRPVPVRRAQEQRVQARRVQERSAMARSAPERPIGAGPALDRCAVARRTSSQEKTLAQERTLSQGRTLSQERTWSQGRTLSQQRAWSQGANGRHPHRDATAAACRGRRPRRSGLNTLGIDRRHRRRVTARGRRQHAHQLAPIPRRAGSGRRHPRAMPSACSPSR